MLPTPSYNWQRENLVYWLNKSFKDSFTIVVIYVDDMVIIGNDPKTIESLKRFFHDRF